MLGQGPFPSRDPVAGRGSGESCEPDNRGLKGVQHFARDLGIGGRIDSDGDTGDHGRSDGDSAGDGGRGVSRSAPPKGQGSGSVGIRRRPPDEREPLLLPPRFDHRDRQDGGALPTASTTEA